METGPALKKINDFVHLWLECSGLDLTCHSHAVVAGDREGVGVDFEGADAHMLVARNGELLHAAESLAVDILRLAPEDHELVSFDAEGFKAARAQRVRHAAEIAIASVQSSGRPYSFPPMSSRERRMLHLELASSGLRTASSGEAARRFVVVYPAAEEQTSTQGDNGGRARKIRNAFRPR